MTELEFNHYWQQNRERLLMSDGEYRDAREHLKMQSGADWLLFAIPAVAAILFFNHSPLKNELLNWAAAAAVTVLTFVVCVWVKSLLTGDRSLSEIEARVKQDLHQQMVGPSA